MSNRGKYYVQLRVSLNKSQKCFTDMLQYGNNGQKKLEFGVHISYNSNMLQGHILYREGRHYA